MLRQYIIVMKKLNHYLSTKNIKFHLKKRILFPLRITDLIDWLAIRRKNPLIPPRRLIWGGPVLTSKTFYEWGKGDIKLFIENCQIRPEHRILDIGCGIGRCAIALTEFLDYKGKYEGFDSHKEAIEMCMNISAQYSNFNFTYADIYNEFYNPNGSIKSSEFQFPYDSEYFNFIFLISVFTHMFDDELQVYLSEISRVLKIGEICFITYFILNDESLMLMKKGKSAFDFKHHYQGCFISNKKRPGNAVAYEGNYLKKVYKENGLQIEKILYGTWRRKEESLPILNGKSYMSPYFTTLQDIVIAKKVLK